MKKLLRCGYVVHTELKNVTDCDARSLDVINIAFAYCRENKVVFEFPENLASLGSIRKANPAIKILFSVGGWGAGGFSPMASTEKGRRTFARSCVELAERFSLDGIDIDWEYPGLDWAGIEASPDDKFNYTLMLRAIRDAFDEAGHPEWMVTVAVGCDSYFIANTEMDKVAEILDYVSIMTYDMRGCGDPVTGHHTNLFPPAEQSHPRDRRSVLHSVEIYHEAGVPYEKMVIGLAFYSRMWKGVQSDTNGYRAPAQPGGYGPGYGELTEKYIGKDGFVEYWDDISKAPYLWNGDTFISYDNPLSIAAKCAFAKEMGLLGLMYWEHSCDHTRTLLKAFSENA